MVRIKRPAERSLLAFGWRRPFDRRDDHTAFWMHPKECHPVKCTPAPVQLPSHSFGSPDSNSVAASVGSVPSSVPVEPKEPKLTDLQKRTAKALIALGGKAPLRHIRNVVFGLPSGRKRADSLADSTDVIFPEDNYDNFLLEGLQSSNIFKRDEDSGYNFWCLSSDAFTYDLTDDYSLSIASASEENDQEAAELLSTVTSVSALPRLGEGSSNFSSDDHSEGKIKPVKVKRVRSEIERQLITKKRKKLKLSLAGAGDAAVSSSSSRVPAKRPRGDNLTEEELLPVVKEITQLQLVIAKCLLESGGQASLASICEYAEQYWGRVHRKDGTLYTGSCKKACQHSVSYNSGTIACFRRAANKVDWELNIPLTMRIIQDHWTIKDA